jgi:putative hydrolase of the HAD superfamily
LVYWRFKNIILAPNLEVKMKENIKAILFDSGRTLNVPSTGHWFITPKFFDIVDKIKFLDKQEIVEKAMEKACEYANKITFVKTEEEEYQMFREFYRIVLKETEYHDFDDVVLDALARDNVFNDDKFLFFDDVEESLKKLNVNYKLGVVSDTWPSLEWVFVNKGLMKYFSTFVMSSVYGSLKAEKILFKIAIDELKIEPGEAVFVDDSEMNLAAAEEFGMIPIMIDRYDLKDLKSNYPIIRSLNEIEKYL